MTTTLKTKPCPNGTASNSHVGIVDPGLDAHFDEEYHDLWRYFRRCGPQYLKMSLQRSKKSKLQKKKSQTGVRLSQPHSLDKQPPKKSHQKKNSRCVCSYLRLLWSWQLGGVGFAREMPSRGSHWLCACRQGLCHGSRLGNTVG
jgi:hypothetical protein